MRTWGELRALPVGPVVPEVEVRAVTMLFARDSGGLSFVIDVGRVGFVVERIDSGFVVRFGDLSRLSIDLPGDGKGYRVEDEIAIVG